MFRPTLRRTLIAWLILAMLLAQGLRVCMHAYGDSAHTAGHAHDAAATHLESTLSTLDSHDEALSDSHVTLLGILKHLSTEPLFTVLFITLLFVLLQPRTVWFAHPPNRNFHLSHGHFFSPPLRAPPR